MPLLLSHCRRCGKSHHHSRCRICLSCHQCQKSPMRYAPIVPVRHRRSIRRFALPPRCSLYPAATHSQTCSAPSAREHFFWQNVSPWGHPVSPYISGVSRLQSSPVCLLSSHILHLSRDFPPCLSTFCWLSDASLVPLDYTWQVPMIEKPFRHCWSWHLLPCLAHGQFLGHHFPYN